MQIPLRKKTKTERKSAGEQLGVSKKEAAQMMGVSYSTLHRLIQADKIRCKRIGRRVVIAVEEIKAYLDRD